MYVLCGIRPSQLEKIQPISLKVYMKCTYLAKKQVPAADLTAGIFPLVECVQPTEVIHVKSTTRNKYRTLTKQQHLNRHSKTQRIQTQNLEVRYGQ